MLGSHRTPKYSLHFRRILWGLPWKSNKTLPCRTSLMVQWIRIRLPMQGTWIWSLSQEDSTCLGATKPIYRNYGARVLRLLKPKHSRACVLQQEKPPQWEAATKSSPYLPQLEKAHMHNKKPAQPKIKTIKKRKEKNSPCSAGDVGSIPSWGTKIPHAMEQLSLHATTTGPEFHS